MKNDKKHVIPRNRYKRRRRVFTEDGQQPMAPYGNAADSDDNNHSEEIERHSNEQKPTKSAAETRREYIEENDNRSHDPVYGYEDLDIDEKQSDDGYQDVYTSGKSKSKKSAPDGQADEVLRAEEPIEDRSGNKDRSSDLNGRKRDEAVRPDEPDASERPVNREAQASAESSRDSGDSANSDTPRDASGDSANSDTPGDASGDSAYSYKSHDSGEAAQPDSPRHSSDSAYSESSGQEKTPGLTEDPMDQAVPPRPAADTPQYGPEDDTPKSAIFGGMAAAAASGAAAKGASASNNSNNEDSSNNQDSNNDSNNQDSNNQNESSPQATQQNPESMKRIQRDKKGRVIKGDPKSSDNNNHFYGTVPPIGAGAGNGNNSNGNNGNNNNNNRGNKGGGGGGFFRSFLIPLIAGILGALLVILLFNVFDGNDTEETATNEQEAGTAEEADQSAEDEATETEATQAIEASRDSVVSVINLQRVDSLLPGIFGEEAETQQTEPEEAGIGSGVIYKTEGDTAYIVTNFHVVEGAEELQVNMQNGESVTANVVGTDVWTDLAVLTIPSEQVEGTLDFADSDALTVGQTAIAIGSPLGEAFSGSVSQGIVSGLDRSVPVDLDGDGGYDWEANVIQTDAAINPGNSGGALIDSNGNLIGINSMKISMPQVEGIGFAIPANEVQKVVSQIEENGEVQRPFFGVTLQDLYTIPPEVLQSEMNLPQDVNSGVVISSVQPGSPAANVGMQQLDLVTALDGNEVGNMMELRQYLYYEKQPGDEMTVEFYRGGEQQTVTVTLE